MSNTSHVGTNSRDSHNHNNNHKSPITVTAQGTYSASPSQLSLATDQMPSSVALQNAAYNYTAYLPHPNETAGFAFPQQPGPGYRPTLQTHGLSSITQHMGQQSPINHRKRRASELGEPSVPGSATSNTSGYSGQSALGLPAGANELDVGLGIAGHTTLPGPAVKKGRTNTPWTPAEEHRLKTLRDNGNSWSDIAKTFPNRTEGSVKKHWYKDMHYAQFTEDEESSFGATLLKEMKDYDAKKWRVIGEKMGKPAKACEAYAKEHGWKM